MALAIARAAADRTAAAVAMPSSVMAPSGAAGRTEADAKSSDGMTDDYYRMSKTGRIHVKGYSTPKRH